MDENINEENYSKKIENKKRYVSKNSLAVRVLAGILAFLMVASLAATLVSYLVNK